MIPELAFSDRPTFTFTPQWSKEFARRLTEPVDINTFAYLAASDWPLHSLLIILGFEINGIVIDPGGDVLEKNAIANKFRQLQDDGDPLNQKSISLDDLKVLFLGSDAKIITARVFHRVHRFISEFY